MKLFALLFCVLISTSTVFATGEGRPLKDFSYNVETLFKTPPNGYGEVPFYWWLGDKLDKEHLLWELELLKNRGVQSLQVNYAHSDKGGKSWGLTFKSDPAVMTEQWWKLFTWFKDEANKRKMTVSLSDYTLGVGQQEYVDRAIAEKPSLRASILKLETIKISNNFQKDFSAKNPLCAAIYKLDKNGNPLPNSRENLMPLINSDKKLSLKREGTHAVYLVFENVKEVSFDPTNKDSGKLYIKHFFGEFERRLGSAEGLNFFFSDELDFKIDGSVWSENLRDEIVKRKGYDLTEKLEMLFVASHPEAAKIRLDYNDVFVALSEENFFKPVYDWHEERGMIYGCDHGGRGRVTEEFGDYFRTQRWNQGPGCDQPRNGKNLIKNKVAASIAHLYSRPRVWLEGFYSSGWDESTESLTDAVFANFTMGQNLLSLHGLYYSTLGTWWEWAPPCNHFHQPYWIEMPELLKCYERISFLFSQGAHRADAAIMYPVESKVAGFGDEAKQLSFNLAEKLYGKHTDFDFIDAQSIERAKFSDGKIKVANEEFEILIICNMRAMRHSTLSAIEKLAKDGAKICFVGVLAHASDLRGSDKPDDAPVGNILSEIIKNYPNVVKFNSAEEAQNYVEKTIPADFKILESPNKKTASPKIMHRKICGKDFYFIYGADKNTVCQFRSAGGAKLFDPFSGEVETLKILEQKNGNTTLRLPLEKSQIQIIAFDKNNSPVFEKSATQEKKIATMKLDGKWNFKIKPALDNTWGDFIYPPSKTLLGAQIRFVKSSQNGGKKEFDQLGYSTKFLVLEALIEPLTAEQIKDLSSLTKQMKPLKISLRFGVLGDYGHQGYHGLKGEIYDDFIRLGDIKKEMTQMRRVGKKSGTHYYLFTNVYAPRDGEFKIVCGATKPAEIFLNGEKLSPNALTARLKRGKNQLLLHYPSHCTTQFFFADPEFENKYFSFAAEEKKLASNLNGAKFILPFDAETDFSSPLIYEFESAPALEELRFSAHGDDVKVFIDGTPAALSIISSRDDGLKKFSARAKKINKGFSKVLIEIGKPKAGYSGGSALPYYIDQICGEGEIEAVSWDNFEGLKSYSGGAIYSKTLGIPKEFENKKIVLDLKGVVSTARLRVNGQQVGVLFAPPWKFDISKFLKSGKNLIEVEIYNTAANHYLTTPTDYRGSTKSGLTQTPEIEIFEVAK